MAHYSSLITRGLIKTYGKRDVVNNVSIKVNRGEVVGLLGPNGAGKTTTFYMMTGMIRPTGGQIFLDDTEITKMAMYRRARSGVGYLAQEPSVFTKLSVENNLRLVLQMTSLASKQQKQRLEELLDELNISHIRKSKAHTLSGGERRRTEIARALVMEPDFILLDEPFAGVDPLAVEDIQKIVNNLKAKDIGVLITDHNVRETLTITDRAYLLFEGSIFYSGTARELTENEEVKHIYLGSKFSMEFEN